MAVGVTVVLPALLQALTIYGLVVANTGNGSWVGLGAVLLGVPFLLACIPINLGWARRHRDRQRTAMAWALATAFLLPVAILAGFWAFGTIITELGLHK